MISERNRYVLKTLCFLADQDNYDYWTMAKLTNTLNIPRGYLNQIIPELVDLGYVESKRGKGGGVRLAQTPDCIRVRDVLEDTGFLQHPEADTGDACCSPVGFDLCLVDMWVDGLRDNVIGDLTFQDLCEISKDDNVSNS